MKISFKIVFFFISIVTFGQLEYNKNAITNETKKIVKKIVKINELMGSAVYSTGMQPKQWDNLIHCIYKI